MIIKLANRLKNFDSSTIRNAFSLAGHIIDPIDLSIGYPADDTPKYIKQAGIDAVKSNHTRYTPTNGIPELRDALSKKLLEDNDIDVLAENITVTPGVTTAILLCYLALLDPGDEVLLPDPFFPPYRDLASMLGAQPVLVDTAPSFQLTAELIEPLITKKTKVLVINSPNNPSGAIYPEKELRKIVSLARKHNITIISDEVYEYFIYTTPHFSVGSIYDNVLTLNGFSKSYAMTGWRVGYVAGPQPLIEAINELQQYIVFSSSSIGQYAALEALKNKPAIAGKYKNKRDLSLAELSRAFPNIHGADGAFYIFLQLPPETEDMRFVNQVSHKGVIILPGSAFSQHKNYVRVSFASEEKNLKEGLARISKTIQE
jgi:aspartate aminotransferase/aminotransferase